MTCDGNSVSDTQVTQLGKLFTIYTFFLYLTESHITEFMSYRQNFKATLLPKMHMLKEHVIPWLKKWHIGSGMMGEQGAESFFNLDADTLLHPRGLTD